MRRTIEMAAAAVLVVCISASGAAFAAEGKAARGVQAGGTSCAYSVAANATPAARCAAIRRQCGGKFFANACGTRMLSAT